MSEDVTSKTEFELEARKELARSMGIEFHPSIGLEKLNAKIQDAVDAETAELSAPVAEEVKGSTERTPEEIRAEAMRLVRIRVSCMNPAKKDYEGDIFATGNTIVGTVRKYVHFNVEWHVPNIIYNLLKTKKYQAFVEKKVRSDTGVVVRVKEGRLIPEYAIELLDPLTSQEIGKLAQRQAMASGTAEA